jgi:hypothetical protein
VNSSTRPAKESNVALFVALPADVDDVCRETIGEHIGVVRANDGAAACSMVGVARPRLIIATLDLSAKDRALLDDAAVATGARVVFLASNADAMTIERIVANAVAVAFA